MCVWKDEGWKKDCSENVPDWLAALKTVGASHSSWQITGAKWGNWQLQWHRNRQDVQGKEKCWFCSCEPTSQPIKCTEFQSFAQMHCSITYSSAALIAAVNTFSFSHLIAVPFLHQHGTKQYFSCWCGQQLNELAAGKIVLTDCRHCCHHNSTLHCGLLEMESSTCLITAAYSWNHFRHQWQYDKCSQQTTSCGFSLPLLEDACRRMIKKTLFIWVRVRTDSSMAVSAKAEVDI